MKIGKDGLKIGTATITVMSIYFSRALVARYCEISRVIVTGIVGIGFICVAIVLLYKKEYFKSGSVISMTIPFGLLGLGFYFDNILLVLMSLISMFLVLGISELIKKYLDNR